MSLVHVRRPDEDDPAYDRGRDCRNQSDQTSPEGTAHRLSFMSMRREVVMRMGTEAMMLLAAFSIGIDVDHRAP